jgi:predicted O-methyltransferase YrrM
MSRLHQIQSYLRYRRKAVSNHGVHSPFVFDLQTHIFPPQKADDFAEHPAELWRGECQNNQATIDVLDFGTGKSGPRKISAIARNAAKGKEEGQLLYRIVRHFKPKRILEIGSSLGITSLYLASANPFEKFISLEGCPQTANQAETAFEKFKFPLQILKGEFGQTLLPALQKLEQVDFVYFDGNHQEKPTLDYFNDCLQFAHPDAIFIFDDIHWSEGMEAAWAAIKADSRVRLSIDLYHFGIVFFREEQKEKAHFVLKF